MTKMTLMSELKPDSGEYEKIIMETNAENLLDVLEVVDRFIKAVGYNPKGTLEYFEE